MSRAPNKKPDTIYVWHGLPYKEAKPEEHQLVAGWGPGEWACKGHSGIALERIKALVVELEKFGYDPTTVRFSIAKKPDRRHDQDAPVKHSAHDD